MKMSFETKYYVILFSVWWKSSPNIERQVRFIIHMTSVSFVDRDFTVTLKTLAFSIIDMEDELVTWLLPFTFHSFGSLNLLGNQIL